MSQPVAVKAVPRSKVAAEARAQDRRPGSEAKPLLKVQPKGRSRRTKPEPEPKSAPKPNGKAGRPLPSIVARAEAAKGKSSRPLSAFLPTSRMTVAAAAPTIEPRRESGPRLEPAMRGQAAARQQVAEPMAYLEEPSVVAAMSAVREVEVEPGQYRSIRRVRSIAPSRRSTARRAARRLPPTQRQGRRNADADEPEPSAVASSPPSAASAACSATASAAAERNERRSAPIARRPGGAINGAPRRDQSRAAEAAFQRPPVEPERGGISAVTIFLAVFAVLLVGAGGAGIWAWREGYSTSMHCSPAARPSSSRQRLPETDLAVVPPSGRADGDRPGQYRR